MCFVFNRIDKMHEFGSNYYGIIFPHQSAETAISIHNLSLEVNINEIHMYPKNDAKCRK